jgi:uncharacterized protein
MSNDVEFIKNIVTGLTGDDECFTVERSVDERGVLLELTIEKEAAGRVLGKSGQTAMAIRTLLRALGHRNDARYSLRIIPKE